MLKARKAPSPLMRMIQGRVKYRCLKRASAMVIFVYKGFYYMIQLINWMIL